ncbi:MAG: stage V sporulation T C-terminal domain-containing protein [Christensenellales bacterium]
MKATGIVRRIDELGRIVIPKEIRRTHKIREGTPLEIYSSDNGELTLKKFSPVLELEDVASDVCKSIYDVLELNILICDKDSVISINGSSNFKKNYLHKNITLDVEKIIEQRKPILLNLSENSTLIPIIKDLEIDFSSLIIVPISSQGDTYGAIILVGDNSFSNLEVKVLQSFANFISLQIG